MQEYYNAAENGRTIDGNDLKRHVRQINSDLQNDLYGPSLG